MVLAAIADAANLEKISLGSDQCLKDVHEVGINDVVEAAHENCVYTESKTKSSLYERISAC